MGITNVYCCKEDQTLRSIADLREVNKRIDENRINPKNPRITAQTQRVSTCHFFGSRSTGYYMNLLPRLQPFARSYLPWENIIATLTSKDCGTVTVSSRDERFNGRFRIYSSLY
jgi:hypothetical protein